MYKNGGWLAGRQAEEAVALLLQLGAYFWSSMNLN